MFALRFKLLSPIVLGITCAVAVAAFLPTIIMGTKDLPGGATKLGNVSPGSIGPNQGKAEGTVCNKTTIAAGDIGFEIIGGTATSVKILNLDGTEVTTANFQNGYADARFPSNGTLANNGCVNYSISGLAASGTGLVSIFATPSKPNSPGSGVHSDILAPVELDRVGSLRRNGVPYLFNPGVLFITKNADNSQRINRIDGAIQVVGNSSASISSVSVTDALGAPLPGASYTISGLTYAVTGFTPIAPGASFHTTVVLNSGSVGYLLRSDIEASFVQ